MKCPECGSDNIVFSVDIPNFHFWLDENGNIEVETDDIADMMREALDNPKSWGTSARCYYCGKSFVLE